MASTDFINECKNRANANRLGQLIVDGIETPISNKNNLQKISIDDSCYVDGNIIGSVFVKKLTAEFIGIEDNNQLVDKQLYARIGVKYADNSTEYVDMGNYTIERPKDEKTANYSQITAYDDLAENIDKKYVCGINYSQGNITVSNLYQDVCRQLGLSPKTLTFLNSDIPISNDPFVNGETNRTVLQSIGKVACSFITIDSETNKIDLSWLNTNEEPDYEFLENDYSILDGGIVNYGPINSVTIKNSVIDDENVTQTDQTSITANGEHSLVISEDYILYNAELRQQAITSIFNRLNGLKYVDCKLTTYYGKPFLKIGSKIRINSKNSFFDTYVLKHNFTYDGTFTSVIESPVLTKQQIKNKQQTNLQKKLANTQIIVDKQNQIIQSVVEQTDAQNQKINKVTQTVDELNSKISDIADTTTSNESTKAMVELDNVNRSEPVRLVVRPFQENISYLYPNTGLYPSDDLFLKVRTVRFNNTKTGEIFDYELPDDLLYHDEENYDEFILDYAGKSCVVNKRVKYNADGTTYVLNDSTIMEYEYPKIELTDGDYVVSLLGYENAYLLVRLMAQNIYTTQYPTRSEVSSEISQTANSITTEVNQKLSNYSTTTEVEAKIEEKIIDSEAIITSTVSKKYATKDELDSTSESLNSKIEQTVTGITNTVSANYATKNELNNASTSLNSKIEQTATSITNTVSSTYETKNNAQNQYSKLEQKDNSISATVANNNTKANIIAKINDNTSQVQINANNISLAGKTIDMTSDNIAIKSNNFNVDKNGNMTCNNANINGGTINVTSTYNVPNLIVSGTDRYDTNSKTYYGPDGLRTFFEDKQLINPIRTELSGDYAYGVQYSTTGTEPKYTRIDGLGINVRKGNVANEDFTSIGWSGISTTGDITCKDVLSTGNLEVYGLKNRIVVTENFGKRLLNAYETATPYFGDIGSGVTDEGGYCKIKIENIFKETIETGNYKVFIQECGEGSLYVKKHDSYFEVIGTPNLEFDWEIKAIQKGYKEIRLEEKKIKSEYGE